MASGTVSGASEWRSRSWGRHDEGQGREFIAPLALSHQISYLRLPFRAFGSGAKRNSAL
jgi:hypothetical protein